MVFTFEHVDLDERPARAKWDVVDLPLPRLKQNLAAWQHGLADVGWNSLYWNNHDQPRAVSRFGDDSPEHRVASAKTLGTVLHLHRGTPYVYQGEELGMTNAGFTSIDAVPRHRVGQLPRRGAGGRACTPRRCWRRWRVKGRDNARTPMQWDAGPHAGLHHGRTVAPGQPEPRRDQRRCRAGRPGTRCSTTTAR